MNATQQTIEEHKDSALYRMARRAAALDLLREGVEEVGSSDVSCRLQYLLESLGSIEEVVMYGAELEQ